MTLWGESEQDISSHCKHMTLHTVSNVWISDYIHYIHNRVLCTAQKRNWVGRLRQTHTKCKLKRTHSYQASIPLKYMKAEREPGESYHMIHSVTDTMPYSQLQISLRNKTSSGEEVGPTSRFKVYLLRDGCDTSSATWNCAIFSLKEMIASLLGIFVTWQPP